MWFDDVQLELLTETINEFNLLENSDFCRNFQSWNTYNSPWASMAPEEVAGMSVVPVVTIGNTTDRIYAEQIIQVTNGKKGDAYSIGTWAKGASVPLVEGSDRAYGVCLTFTNEDGSTTSRRISCNPTYDGWQFVTGEAIADKNYTKVTFCLEYSYNDGEVYFARPFLYKDNYGQSYSYDKDGNIISAADQTQNATTYAYNHNQLSKLASPTGSVQMMSYNQETNNLISAMTTNGQRYEYEYDSFGNMTQVRVGIDNFVQTLEHNGTYILRNAATGNAFSCDGLDIYCVCQNQQWQVDSLTQTFTLLATGEADVYQMHPYYAEDSLRVDVVNEDQNPGAKIQIFALNSGSNCQSFKFIQNDNGTFSILTKISGYTCCIDGQPENVSYASNGVAVRQETYVENDPGQQWYLVEYSPSVTDDLYIQSSAEYTNSGNYVSTITDALGNKTYYDTNESTGNPISVYDSRAIGSKYSYDAYGIHNTKVSVHDGPYMVASTSYTYSNDRLATVKNDITGQTQQLVYDTLGRISQNKVGNATTTSTLATYNYNEDNLLSKLTYGNNDYVNYLYDRLGRQTKMWYNTAEDAAVETIYNDHGLIGLLKDYGTDTRTRYEYDIAGRLIHLRRTNGAATDRDWRIGEVFNYFENATNRLAQRRIITPFFTSVFSFTYGDFLNGQIPDNIYSVAHNGTTEIEYTYDELGRLSERILSVPDIATTYYYTNFGSSNQTSAQVKLITTPTENVSYNYDVAGNITEVFKDTVLNESYTYDTLSQMTAATVNGKNYTYTYNRNGNILTAFEDGTTNTYTYGNSAWADLLTAYNGQTITYDAIGNPLTYRDGMTFTWQNGRQLASTTKGSTVSTYTYNADGGRKAKTVGNKTYNYYYVDGVLYAMTVNNYTLYFMYDDTGRPYSFIFNIDTGSGLLSYTLYYKYNLQGDVVGIYNTSGTEMVWYEYDPWGKLLSSSGPMSSALGGLNPFLYRGYIYDYDTGLYYCNDRYYDPEIGRWINADGTSMNMFAYCGNNPVMLKLSTESTGSANPSGITQQRFINTAGVSPHNSVVVISNSETAWMISSQTMGNNLAATAGSAGTKVYGVNDSDFVNVWNYTRSELLIIHTHGGPDGISGKDFTFNVDDTGLLSANSNIKCIIITACSTGGNNGANDNIAQTLSKLISPSGIVVCSTTTSSGADADFEAIDGGEWVIYQNGQLLESNITNPITMSYIYGYVSAYF